MIRRPPRSTRTDTLFPYTTLFRSVRDFRFDVGDPLNPCTPSSTCVPFDPIYLTQAGRDQLLAGAPPGGGGEFRLLNNALKTPYSDQFSIGLRTRSGHSQVEPGFNSVATRHGFVYLLALGIATCRERVCQ